MRRRTHARACSESDRAKGAAALAALTLLLCARKKCGAKGPATNPSARGEPKPTKPERTKLRELLHWFTTPVRHEDKAQWKREYEEKAIKEAEEESGVTPTPEPGCKKVGFGCLTVSCDETAKKDSPEKEEAKEDGGESSLTGITVKVLGAIATGVGVTGAVVVVGAAIFWARFDAIGVPPVQAVTAIPRTELLVQGAQEMIIFVLIGLGAALLIALADPKGAITYGTLFVLGGLVLGAAIFAITTELSWAWVLGLIGLTLILALATIGIGFTTKQRLLPLLISVFVASFVFSASCAFLIVETQKFAQAIAIHFGPNEKRVDITGVYVTVTEKTIFYARSDLFKEPAGLYEAPRGEATTYAVGRLKPIEEDGGSPVRKSAKRLLTQLQTDAEAPTVRSTNKGAKTAKVAKGK